MFIPENIKSAAKNNDPSAIIAIGDYYYQSSDYQEKGKAFSIYCSAIKIRKDSPDAYYKLGLCYQNGIGHSADPDKALYCFKTAARGGHSVAQFTVADSLRKSNNRECVEWYSKALSNGQTKAAEVLSQFCYTGEFCNRDVAKAVECAIKSGNRELLSLYLPEDFNVGSDFASEVSDTGANSIDVNTDSGLYGTSQKIDLDFNTGNDEENFENISSSDQLENTYEPEKIPIEIYSANDVNTYKDEMTDSVVDEYAEKQSVNPSKPDRDKVNSFLSQIYVIGFAKSLISKDRIGIDIWLVMNLFVITGVFAYIGVLNESSPALWAVIGVIAFIVSTVLALSPFGEYVLRKQAGCRKIKDKAVIARITPIFNNVYNRAHTENNNISDQIQLFISDEESPNAFATGRRTICLTKGLLQMSDAEIEGIFAHEFGHLSHKDTDALLIANVGNLFVNIFFFVINSFVIVMTGMAGNAYGERAYFRKIQKIFLFFSNAALWLWRKLGILLCRASGRKDEFNADRFAVKLGYADELCLALHNLAGGDYAKPKGLWANLNASHPAISDRINSMNEYAKTLR